MEDEPIETTQNLRDIPHNMQAEQCVLGCCLLNADIVMEVMEKLKTDDFYTNSHRAIFDAMLNIYHSNRPIDHVTLVDELTQMGLIDGVGGLDYIITLTNCVPTAENAKSYIAIVKRDSILRKLIGASRDIIEHAYGSSSDTDSGLSYDIDSLSYAEKLIFDIAEREETSSLLQINDCLDKVLRKFEEIDKNGGQIQGLPTGFTELDSYTNGLQKSDLILLAARPGFGKTSFAMNIVSNVARRGYHCAVFSLEMPREQLVQRMLCSVSSVSMRKALSGSLSSADWKALWDANKELFDKNIFIDDSSLSTPTEILNKCRRLKHERGLSLIVIDYLQLMKSGKKGFDAGKRQLEIADITRDLKIAAKELEVPIILVSQLSRDVEKRADGHKPIMSDLRDSGAIEQDADIVMFIYNAANYRDVEPVDEPNICELIIAKHRNGPLGTIKIKWMPEILTFGNPNTTPEKRSLERTAPPDTTQEKRSLERTAPPDTTLEKRSLERTAPPTEKKVVKTVKDKGSQTKMVKKEAK